MKCLDSNCRKLYRGSKEQQQQSSFSPNQVRSETQLAKLQSVEQKTITHQLANFWLSGLVQNTC
jgi:hypothetical protein